MRKRTFRAMRRHQKSRGDLESKRHPATSQRPHRAAAPRCGAISRECSCLLILCAFALLATTRDVPAQTGNGPVPPPAEIRIDAAAVMHTMAAGAGAEWDALGPTAYRYEGLIDRENRNARGSAWGGNPPLEYKQAWLDLQSHARWLGLDFIRVGIAMRIYEPERGRFDWQNQEMQTLYRILDYCQQNNVDVLLTQMWSDVEWNAFAGINRLQSAPKSVDDFAQGLGVLMEHLIKTRHYTCIRWLCMVNEPARAWGWWLGAEGQPLSLMPALHAVRAELDRRGIAVGLCAPDWVLGQNTPNFDFDDKVTVAFDVHNYAYFPNIQMEKLWAEAAHARGLPFFLSEFGDWAGSDPFTDRSTSTPKSYSNQLVNAEKVIGGMNGGVDGFNRWSFTNRGDLDGQWQLVRTFDTNRWEYFPRVVPEPVPYYAYGILTRFMAKHSAVLHTENSNPDLVAAAVLSPKGNLTVFVMNKTQASVDVKLVIANAPPRQTLYKYQVTESAVSDAHFELNPVAQFTVGAAGEAVRDTLPLMSITAYSTYKLMNSDPGINSD
jgi:hypothetical protein